MYIGGNLYKLSLASYSSFLFKTKKENWLIKVLNCTLCRITLNVLLCTTCCAYLIEILVHSIIVVILVFFCLKKIKI